MQRMTLFSRHCRSISQLRVSCHQGLKHICNAYHQLKWPGNKPGTGFGHWCGANSGAGWGQSICERPGKGLYLFIYLLFTGKGAFQLKCSHLGRAQQESARWSCCLVGRAQNINTWTSMQKYIGEQHENLDKITLHKLRNNVYIHQIN